MYASCLNGPSGQSAHTNARASEITTDRIARTTKLWKRLNNATIAHASLMVSPTQKALHLAIQTTNARYASASKDTPNAIQTATTPKQERHAKTSQMTNMSSAGSNQRLANAADTATKQRVRITSFMLLISISRSF